ncbi:DoxX family protein [Niabella aurantiaca]|uniref:DoxX family protein n=1 Tax=Niabella aurantiaca TaxID=379900 RepID=UPI0003624278|nr:DoxX family protein [Niabella aurantiaca]
MDTQASNDKRISKARLRVARVMGGIVILFMLFDGIMKLIMPPSVVEATVALGFARHHIPVIGVLALISTALYAIPRTSVFGVVLLTGYYGGVVVSHLRLDNPLFTHTLFPVYLAILAWGALLLTNEQLRTLFGFSEKKI